MHGHLGVLPLGFDLISLTPKTMKTLRQLFLSFSLIGLMFTIGCVEEPLDAQFTTSELIAGEEEEGRSYFIHSAEISLFNLNGTLGLDECVTDNTIIYYPGGRYEENEGRTKCEVENPPGVLGTWLVTNRETQISIVIDGEKEVWRLDNVTGQGHTLSRTATDGKVTFVLKRF